MTRRLALAAALVAAGALAASAGPKTRGKASAPVEAPWGEPYDGGFYEATLPTGWTAMPSGGDGKAYNAIWYRMKKASEGRVDFDLWLPGPMTDETILQMAVRPGMRLLSKVEKVRAGSLQGIQAATTHPRGYSRLTTVFKLRDGSAQITCSSAPDRFSEIRRTCEKIAASFRLKS